MPKPDIKIALIALLTRHPYKNITNLNSQYVYRTSNSILQTPFCGHQIKGNSICSSFLPPNHPPPPSFTTPSTHLSYLRCNKTGCSVDFEYNPLVRISCSQEQPTMYPTHPYRNLLLEKVAHNTFPTNTRHKEKTACLSHPTFRYKFFYPSNKRNHGAHLNTLHTTGLLNITRSNKMLYSKRPFHTSYSSHSSSPTPTPRHQNNPSYESHRIDFQLNKHSQIESNSSNWRDSLSKFGENLQSNFQAKVKRIIKDKYLFNEELHDEVYMGMHILDSPHNMEHIDQQIQMINNSLIEFAGDINPFDLTAHMLRQFDNDLLEAVRTSYPELSEVSQYLLINPGKRFRPVLMLLVNHIISESGMEKKEDIYDPTNNKMIEVAELIHTASIMHDDVLDNADMRRGSYSANKKFGNKKAILGGDFLLARACRIAAEFGIPQVCERTSKIVECLVKGELIQGWGSHKSLDNAFDTYLTKTYYKTAALMAEACACSAIIGGYSEDTCKYAFTLGGLIGMAFQLYDDLLDYTVTSNKLGKPALNDIKSGVVTAPLFLSALENSELLFPIIKRRMSYEGDFDTVMAYVYQGLAMPRTQLLVLIYVNSALEMLKNGPNMAKSTSIYSKGLASLLLKMLKFSIK